jgi:type III secretory pathway component EscU
MHNRISLLDIIFTIILGLWWLIKLPFRLAYKFISDVLKNTYLRVVTYVGGLVFVAVIIYFFSHIK